MQADIRRESVGLDYHGNEIENVFLGRGAISSADEFVDLVQGAYPYSWFIDIKRLSYQKAIKKVIWALQGKYNDDRWAFGMNGTDWLSVFIDIKETATTKAEKIQGLEKAIWQRYQALSDYDTSHFILDDAFFECAYIEFYTDSQTDNDYDPNYI